MKLLNAFSLSMLPNSMEPFTVRVRPVELEEILERGLSLESAIGHASTAAILSRLLDEPVPVARLTIRLAVGETALVAQYDGPRLPEGATTLPDGAGFNFHFVTVEPALVEADIPFGD